MQLLLMVLMEFDHGDQSTEFPNQLNGFGLKTITIMTKLMVLILLRELIYHYLEKNYPPNKQFQNYLLMHIVERLSNNVLIVRL